MLIKGVLTAEDTRLALDNGADGVVVSNHGGRQLDGSLATIEALPDIVDAARDAVVIIDGGFRRGSDIVKALALGAKGVLVGRATLMALRLRERPAPRVRSTYSASRSTGVALLGCHSIAELGSHHVASVDRLGIRNPARSQVRLREASRMEPAE